MAVPQMAVLNASKAPIREISRTGDEFRSKDGQHS
jgi:hypothetical protein